eukprot:CAMPEP_0115094918 /NCGR_PEP_ID=MMETSP0227-20121206/28678_1 /TAXON_ID=89957 /ORGANISM="Polarella glacialis, Strain CCMP 1383" /LENGTH=100 /DNA_ID=CAMNT_0002488081 /DNA_START=83 /DNA_END=385 /DNA_ORIENTATION=+
MLLQAIQRPRQGVTVAEFAQNTSVSALFARMQARSKGAPLPFVAGHAAVSMEEKHVNEGIYVGGKKIALSNKFWMMYDNVMLLTILMPAGFVWFMNRVPK